MVRWRRRASSARYGVGATALTLRRLELAGWSSGGIGLVAARASRARGSEKEVVNEGMGAPFERPEWLMTPTA